MTNKTLRCWLAIELSKPLNQSLNKSKVIQAFGLAEYCTGNVIPLKQRGFLNLPMVNNGYFSVPSMFAHTMTVILSLDFFPPKHFSDLNASVLSGNNLQRALFRQR